MPDLRNGPARLLVVDDNKVNRLLLTRSLELHGHSVASAENGRVALEMLRREGFDLVLLDMEMPEMDGFQVLEQLVNDRQLRDLPVIVTSSLEGIANIVRCIELGAEDYLTKPVDPQILVGDASKARAKSRHSRTLYLQRPNRVFDRRRTQVRVPCYRTRILMSREVPASRGRTALARARV